VLIRVLGAYGGSSPSHRLTSFLINDSVCLDAGALTEALTLEEQARVKTVLLTHSHMDHVASLPFLVENVFGKAEAAIEVIAPGEVVSALGAHLFNDALWPDFTRIPNHLLPTVSFRSVVPGVPFAMNGLTVTAIPVFHVVPTFGYLISSARASVIFSGDTGPTDEVWRVARSARDLKAIFVECSFPDAMQEVAEVSRHLTPSSLKQEMVKFPAGVPVYLYHMKPPTLAAVRREVHELLGNRVRLLADDERLTF
jgi:ribonuclease BN (tRNA processing enzyme)